MLGSACFRVDLIILKTASLFDCTAVGRASDSGGPSIGLFILVLCCLAIQGVAGGFLFLISFIGGV